MVMYRKQQFRPSSYFVLSSLIILIVYDQQVMGQIWNPPMLGPAASGDSHEDGEHAHKVLHDNHTLAWIPSPWGDALEAMDNSTILSLNQSLHK
jgi:hypothetical protein